MQWLLIGLLVILALVMVLLWPLIEAAAGIVVALVTFVVLIGVAIWLWYTFSTTRRAV